MKTVEDILRETGLTDEQIKALDPKVVSGFTAITTSAQQDLDKSELVRRAQQDQYDKQISPALDNWANEKAGYDAKIAAYDAALKSAQEGGFKVPEILSKPVVAPTTDNRDGGGRFIAGQGAVPGSPQFVEGIRKEIGTAWSFATDVQWKYQTLFGKMIPDSPTTLVREAVAEHMNPMEYAAKKYGFVEKEHSLAAAEKKAEIDKAVSEAVSAKEKEYAERFGSNPDVRRAESSKFSEITKAVKEGTRPDPLKLSETERDAATRRSIQAEVSERVQ